MNSPVAGKSDSMSRKSPSPAEVDHLAHCEQCHALAEAGELLSQALADWARVGRAPGIRRV